MKTKKEVRWVIQDNLISENDRQELQEACKSINVECENIIVIPFTEELPEFTYDDKINLYYGSTTFIANLHKKYPYELGVFFNDNFSMENYLSRWGEYMLNSGGRVITFKQFMSEGHPVDSLWFLRPDDDSKSFSGCVKEYGDVQTWFEGIKDLFDNVELNEYTKILVSEPFNIKKEWRCYIVDGKVATASLYQENFKLKKSGTDIPEDMLAFVEARCKEYMPHVNFAMDIALCGDEYYIIECGCLNSVGLYHADINKFVKSLSEWAVK